MKIIWKNSTICRWAKKVWFPKIKIVLVYKKCKLEQGEDLVLLLFIFITWDGKVMERGRMDNKKQKRRYQHT